MPTDDWTSQPFSLAGPPQPQPQMPPSTQAPWPRSQPAMTWHQQQVLDYMQRQLYPPPAPTLSDSPRASYAPPGGMAGQLGVRAAPLPLAFRPTPGVPEFAPAAPYPLPNAPDWMVHSWGYRDPNQANPLANWFAPRWNNSPFGRLLGPWWPQRLRGT